MKILLIEDDLHLAKTLKDRLEGQCFAVDMVHDGEKGLYTAKINDYDCIITDYLLPKIDGRALVEELRAVGNITPIMMLTVRSELPSKVELLNLGVDDYLTKPYSFDELLARVNALLRRPKAYSEQTLQSEDLVLNSSKHECKRGDVDIYLTRKEMMLLEYMMRNPGAVLTRSMIMEHVWDSDIDPFSNTIETHIMSLRKKVDS
ncbi:response regulator transcription factor, partial [Patescibacteria group bacterium]|nr:response regulator transcription factor [Patescibacteria group bacterium]